MTGMLAAVYYGPEDLRVEEKTTPRPGPGELLIRVDAASLCATDLRILRGAHRKYPAGTIRVPGHEVVGSVAMLGARVEEYHLGQTVFIAPNIGCGRCRHCLLGRNNLCANFDALGITIDGAFAEYMLVPARAIEQGNVIHIRTDADAAVMALAEPLACVWHGQEAVNVGDGDVVVIQGAGPIGLMHCLLAQRRGAPRIIVSDKSPERLLKAAKLGVDVTVNVSRQSLDAVVAEETKGDGADVVIVAVASHKAQQQALTLAAIGGRVNLFSGLAKQQPMVAMDVNLIHYRELIVTGTTACSTADCQAAVRLLESREIDLTPLVSRRFPLREANAAFSAASESDLFKVVLEP
jgi:L-iditol 2-dehydrogenase